MSLGTFIAKKRRLLRLTQEELAAKMHVSKSAIAKWETDGGIPDRENLKNLADAFDTSVNDLYRIIERYRKPEKERVEVNITGDIISLLESYGYVVIRPEAKNE